MTNLWLEHGDLVYAPNGFSNREVRTLTNSEEFANDTELVMVGRPSPNGDMPLRWLQVSLTGFGRNQPRFNQYPEPRIDRTKFYQISGVKFTIGHRSAHVMPNGTLHLGKQMPDWSWEWHTPPSSDDWYQMVIKFGVHIVDFKYLKDGISETISVNITEIPAQPCGKNTITHYQEWVFSNMRK